ncbi:MAG: UDP-3-O-(3-hydroxymyristoyl)glucosamine N-acyltransferase [Planctomycetia bacterium]
MTTPTFTLGELAQRLDARLDGPAGLRLAGVGPLEAAGPEELTFVKDERALARLAASRAGAVLCRPGDPVGGRPALRCAQPRLAAARAVALFRPEPPVLPGRHPSAVVAPDAVVPASCQLGPLCVVEAGVVLGERVVLGPHCVVGAGARVGDDTRLDARVVLYAGVRLGRRCRLHAGVVVGAPGFGYEPTAAGPVGFPQHGTVELGDDVRVGANSTIDRATFLSTRVGDGAAFDNLVQVSHNVQVGPGVLVCALAGLGGGARLGRHSVVGPQGALAPEAVLGEGTILGARGAIASHQRLEAPGQVFMGDTPMPLEDWKRWQVLRLRAGRRRGPASGSLPA